MSTCKASHGGDRSSSLVPEPVVPPVTFIVRVTATGGERVNGIVEHPGTGRKERFDGLEALGRVISARSLSVGGPQMPTGAGELPAPVPPSRFDSGAQGAQQR